VDEFTNVDEIQTWNVRGLSDWVNLNFPLGIPESEFTKAASAGTESPVPDSVFDGLTPAQFSVCQFVCQAVRNGYNLKINYEDPVALNAIERYTILSAVDRLWQEHLYGMDSLRNSIGLRAYAQRDPLIEYKAEAYKVFQEMMVNIKTEVCHNIFRSASSMMAFENFLRNMPRQTTHQSVSSFGGGDGASTTATASSKASDMVTEATEAVSKAKPVRSGPKVGRNDPCPCGSGKKYKQCCGKN